MATLLDLTSFGHGVGSAAGTGLFDLFQTGSGTFSISVAGGRNGRNALRSAKGNFDNYARRTSVGTAGGVNIASFWVKFAAFPSGTEKDYVFACGGSGRGMFGIDSAGVTQAWANQAGTPATGPTFTTGTWHYIDLRLTTSGTTHTLDWYVDGVLQTQATYAAGASANVNGYEVGCVSVSGGAATGCDVYITDVVYGQTSGDFPLGPCAVEALIPSGDGAHSVGADTFRKVTSNGGTTANITNSTTDAYTVVDEWPPTADGNAADDWIDKTAGTTTAYVRIEVADPTFSSAPMAIRSYAAIQGASASPANNIQVQVYETTTAGSNIFNGSIASASTIYKSVVNNAKPSTGAWTLSALQNVNLRILSNDVAPVPRVKALLIEAAFSDPQGGAPSATDSGTETEGASSIAATVSGTNEAVTSTEGTSAISATVTGTNDSATLSETSSVVSTLAVSATDSGALTETSAVAAAVSGTAEAVAASETSSVAAAVAGTAETATATEGTSALALTRADTVTLTEGTSALAVATTDSGALTEGTSAVVASPSVTDSGTATEGTSAVAASASTTDTGTLTDATQSAPATVTGTNDQATLSETSAVAAAVASTGDSATATDARSSLVASASGTPDSASLTDTTSALAAQAQTTDSAALTDVSSVSQGGNPSASDSATATETSAVSITSTSVDSAALTDASSVQQTVQVSATDSAAASDSSSLSPSASATDAAGATETSAVAAQAATTDTASASDSSQVTPSITARADSGTLSETSSIAVVVTTADSGSLNESSGAAVQFTRSDAATLTDASQVQTFSGVPITASDTATLAEGHLLVVLVGPARMVASVSGAHLEGMILSGRLSAGLSSTRSASTIGATRMHADVTKG